MKDGIPAWSVVLLVPNGNLFLALSKNFDVRNPALPGGDSEPSDMLPAETAARELYEETGLRASELRCMEQWTGERGQPVFAFFIAKWRGKRLRSSEEGKPYWTEPHKLLVRSAQYRNEARRLFEKLGRVQPAVTA